MTLIGIATCEALPDLDDVESMFLEALLDAGVQARAAVWSDPSVDWSQFDAVVIRSTWDYSDRVDEFVPWARRVDAVSRLFNPSSIVAWNTDKHYLADLARSGVPIVPTRFIEPGDDWSLGGVADEFVVKPAVSCGSRDTMRYVRATSGDAPAAHVARLLDQRRSVMVQPYLASVDSVGESALIFIDGEFSHSIRKGQMLEVDRAADKVAGLYVAEPIDPRTALEDELDVAARVLAAIPGGTDQVLYARVDLIRDESGAPVLLELELTEPSLFFQHRQGAASRLASAVLDRI